ncbi:glycosyltransferase, partial [Acinetobacter baumannii]
AWNGTHVPMTTLGRFFLPQQVSDSYARLLYIDGDTVFRSNPAALLQCDPGPGRIAAVEDVRSFARRDWVGKTGRITRDYFEDIGVAADQGYFNGGV